jgi:hypothetical protein
VTLSPAHVTCKESSEGEKGAVKFQSFIQGAFHSISSSQLHSFTAAHATVYGFVTMLAFGFELRA